MPDIEKFKFWPLGHVCTHEYSELCCRVQLLKTERWFEVLSGGTRATQPRVELLNPVTLDSLGWFNSVGQVLFCLT